MKDDFPRGVGVSGGIFYQHYREKVINVRNRLGLIFQLVFGENFLFSAASVTL